jgi:putative membrane-bound dehydrogenase-like protein
MPKICLSRCALAFILVSTAGFQSAAQNPTGFGPKAAEECVKNFGAAAGLTVSLFASEPMVRNPTDIDVDAYGRVWVAEAVNYRSSFKPWGVIEPAGDRIVILEDTNHDGTADKETVFYQDPSINSPIGICVLGNKVIVSDSPNVFVLTDTDGDGRADRRELLFTGIGGYDHDHGVHAFSFGPDGKLYFNMGNESKQLRYPLNKELPLHGPVGVVASTPVVDLAGNEVKPDGKPYRMGMVFRCNPDGSDVETLAWNFRNPYEVAVDSFGTIWQSDNDDDGNHGTRINYIMQYGNYGYCDERNGAGWSVGWDKAHAEGAPEDSKPLYEWHQLDPGVVPNLLNTGAGAPAGIAIYEGSALPRVFRGQMIHSEPGIRLIRSYPTTKNRAGYSAGVTNMLWTSDTWFRPSDLCVAPDGSVMAADWNDAAVGGHNMADVKLAAMTGRIYRLSGAGSDYSCPNLDLKSVDGCVTALASPNSATRYLAWTRLHAMQQKAEKPLLKLWNGKDPLLQARALQLLARIKGREQRYVTAALKSPNEDLRIAGLRIAQELRLDIIPLVQTLVRDTSPQVGRECAIALRHNKSPAAPKLWADLANQYDGRDPWYLEALGIGADENWDSFFDAWQQKAGDPLATKAGRDIVWRSRSHKTAGLLAKWIGNPAVSEADRKRFFRSLDFCPLPERNESLLELAGLRKGPAPVDKARSIEALSRLKQYDLEGSPEVKAAVERMARDLRGKPEFIELVREFNLHGQQDALLEIAGKSPFDGANVEAVRLLIERKHIDTLRAGLTRSNAVPIARGLGGTSSRQMLSLLSPIVSDHTKSLELRKAAVQSMAQIKPGCEALLKLASDGKMSEDLKLAAAVELSAVRWEAIRAEAASLLPLPKTKDSETLPPIGELARRKGDPILGQQVFRSEIVGCYKCHQVNGFGVDFGPNLSEIGTKLGKDALYEAILQPSAGISFGYEAWQLTLKNGDEPYGLISSETPTELVLRTVGGAKTTYLKAEIASRIQQKLSIMPAGLQQNMAVGELVDLVEYLFSLKKTAPKNEQTAKK